MPWDFKSRKRAVTKRLARPAQLSTFAFTMARFIRGERTGGLSLNALVPTDRKQKITRSIGSQARRTFECCVVSLRAPSESEPGQ